MSAPLVYVDAFADRPFAGNPAAVCLLDAPADDAWMQRLARETNQPATAFVRPEAHHFVLRWFGPVSELEFCGHGTLAAAFALWDMDRLGRAQTARFETRAGPLAAAWRDGWVALDLPAEPDQPAEPPPELLRALGVSPRYTGRNRFDYIVELESEDAVRGLTPDFALLRTAPTRGAIVTARSDDGRYDFVSRFFAPGAGIGEDSVTGSAHCCLGPFWASRLGKREMTGYQASARGGVVRVRVDGARVELQGQAVTVRRAQIAVPAES